ncbi:hypothetical protein [Burkholderia ubonensis]|uniref:Tle cognate immunity protein 4 C-terminal domain-containing protein n=1 Tax=Burkholderia ubonensis TaxID=101571 RepID=A0AB74DC76_9BURK|nr:hypothetical protein [Burkholderia ubonensis]PAJ76883.1 hypothetical protein CJO71_30710 [Burkholderia ubonensis]PAJ85095.1 hypothetical protein CJO70_24270 [Burkholderia ubonensis]PAJ89770.1 hypothetical protein CJO69_34560 [Burkholderia ubonensis]PAJ98118.1 hypothetical protein CJO68_26720 [Burkholderia ubonensis]PAK05178.1 hypothetical protein CJO67_25105 [Burkholderia ubonensis]
MTNQANDQREMVRNILKTAMAILRDDKPFDPSNTVFGRIIDTEPHYRSKGLRYLYATRVSPSTTVAFSTFDDPENYSADRSKVKIVPTGLVMRLSPMLAGLPDMEIKYLLQLEDYWVDSDGNREYGNEMMVRAPDMPNLQSFRYRSKDIPGSKFPVNVELFYANPVDGSFPPKLSEITITRDYKILTPEERKQRRLEERRAKRQKYGEMNLCTGMLCPETGLWQGYTKTSSPTNLVLRKGQRFPMVRTLTYQEEHEQRRPSELVAGQWMWLREEYEHPTWWMIDPESET